MPSPSPKTLNLIEQINRRESEMNPDERQWAARAIAQWQEPEQVGELRRFAMALFTRLNARKAASKRKAA